MFLIRTAFWLALIVMLLPTDQQRQAQMLKTAGESARWAMTFCDRNQSTCETGARHWATFRTKAEFGARMVLDVASERFFGPSASPMAPAVENAPPRAPGRRVGA